MRRGDFSAAWEISDRILAQRIESGQRWDVPRHEQWVWDGRDLVDRVVLVRCYHGLGDTIQFARFLPLVERIARKTIVWAQPSLIPLLSTIDCRGALQLLALHDGSPQVEYDVDIEIMELAHALRVTLDTLPNDVPYLHVPPTARLSDRYSIGVVAASGDWDARRSVPAELLSTIVSETDAAFFNLQLGRPLPHMVDASATNMLNLGSRLKALDLVITVDTMMAHLAGALAAPTWTLLPEASDWRWMEARSDSPWYPTMQLFRASSAGDWEPVLRELRGRLASACVR
jgi:hypothetical protein